MGTIPSSLRVQFAIEYLTPKQIQKLLFLSKALHTDFEAGLHRLG